MSRNDGQSNSAQPQGQQIQIQIDDPTAQGVYANFAMIYHSENEFVLDFAYIQPGPNPPRAKVRSRVILAPKNLKKVLGAIETNLRKFEERFGPIDSFSEEPPVFH